ncbi:hypothetical protein ACLQ2Q_08570 [Microbacterium sp. DT81.1]|uniref:hypothetical protein n=1 Tax=Microbacterium sp. DT81.1 TaxID=3393413 RepID=UPI003CEFAC98
MQIASTSTQRTYRYLRLSIVGAVVLLFVALAITIVHFGPMLSVSAAIYTPARNIFVGSNFAVALALLALSGRSLSQALLDYAAIAGALIATVPAPLEPGQLPPSEADLAGVQVGLLSLLIVGVAALVAIVAVAVVQHTLTPAIGLGIAVAAVIIVAVAVWWLVSPISFLAWAHIVAAFTFFVLIAAVSGLAAWTVDETSNDAAAATRAMYRVLYSAIAIGILVALAFLVVVIVLETQGIDLVEATGLPLIFIGEAAALLLFAAFWLIQTVELWDEPDPRLRVAPGE